MFSNRAAVGAKTLAHGPYHHDNRHRYLHVGVPGRRKPKKSSQRKAVGRVKIFHRRVLGTWNTTSSVRSLFEDARHIKHDRLGAGPGVEEAPFRFHTTGSSGCHLYVSFLDQIQSSAAVAQKVDDDKNLSPW